MKKTITLISLLLIFESIILFGGSYILFGKFEYEIILLTIGLLVIEIIASIFMIKKNLFSNKVN